jgi:high-affinity nickel-transport protein
VAVFIGGLKVLHVMSGQLNLTGGLWDYANNFDLNKAGFVIVGLFVATWVIALSVWRFAHIEEKWSAGIRASESSRVAPATTE